MLALRCIAAIYDRSYRLVLFVAGFLALFEAKANYGAWLD
jgi:hypothetical protein